MINELFLICALSLPTSFGIHPSLWIVKMIAFYYDHRPVFRAIGWAVLAALIYVVAVSIALWIFHNLVHKDPPDEP